MAPLASRRYHPSHHEGVLQFPLRGNGPCQEPSGTKFVLRWSTRSGGWPLCCNIWEPRLTSGDVSTEAASETNEDYRCWFQSGSLSTPFIMPGAVRAQPIAERGPLHHDKGLTTFCLTIADTACRHFRVS